MPGNSFGLLFKITTFGESHGPMLGVILDGVPAGLLINIDEIQWELDKRKPGQSKLSSTRKEEDQFEIVSGIFEGKTTGAPLCAIIKNVDAKEKDYNHLQNIWRPSHADFTWDYKFGFRDHRGGGRSSARETTARVFAGAVAKQYLDLQNIKIQAYVSQVGSVKLTKKYQDLDLSLTETNAVRCPDPEMALEMESKILEVKKEGDTIGGVVSCVISGCPSGLGEPVFDRLSADLAKAMLSIQAAKGFEYGSGFEGVEMKGSEHNDVFYLDNNQVKTKTNYSGGIQGGISNGMDIYFKVAFKPVATILQKQVSIDKKGIEVEIAGKGRHDPCVVPRAVAIVEAMAALVIMDFMLRRKADVY